MFFAHSKSRCWAKIWIMDVSDKIQLPGMLPQEELFLEGKKLSKLCSFLAIVPDQGTDG